MNIIKFITKDSSHSALRIGYKEKYVEEAMFKIFFSLHIDNHINWKQDIEQMIPKLSGACYAVRSVVCISNNNTHSNQFTVRAFILL
jgi:FPC/CPF motif-containing protein YcgG